MVDTLSYAKAFHLDVEEVVLVVRTLDAVFMEWQSDEQTKKG